jgi:glyoxylase-like metal-dependent hydrolase (beta-lactamase superfamily II)
VHTVDDGAVLDLGGRSVTVVHLPGHTAGHCGLLVEPDGFLFLGDIDLTRFAAVIDRRDDALLKLLRQPRTLQDVVAHRLVYRPHVRSPLVEAVERRTALLHLDRLERVGLVVPTGNGYLAV